MDKFLAFLEKNLVPVAAKFGSQRHLVSIRDAFIAMLPISLAGSFAVLINVFVRDIPTATNGGEAPAITEFFAPLIAINGTVWWATLAIMSLFFAFSLAYNLAKNNGVDALPAGIVGLAIFIATVPQAVVIPDTIMAIDETGEAVTSLWGNLNWSYLSGNGLFTAMLSVLVFIEVYMVLVKKKITIKMPEQVPPAVANAFTAVIPGIIAIYLSAMLSYFTVELFAMPINDLIVEVIQKPLLALSQGYFSVLLITLLTQVFWFFGLHGTNVLAPIYESIWGVATLENANAYAAGASAAELPYMWVKESFDVYGYLGGAGATLSMLISMFIVGRRSETKSIAKLAIAPGIFNINEPVVFGVPIVLNVNYLIPWIVAPVVGVTIGYVATAVGLIPPIFVKIPWVTPPVINAYLATGGSLMAIVVSVVCLVVTILIWMPFIIFAEKQADKMYGEE